MIIENLVINLNRNRGRLICLESMNWCSVKKTLVIANILERKEIRQEVCQYVNFFCLAASWTASCTIALVFFVVGWLVEDSGIGDEKVNE